jgi:hypothetical protein
MRDLTDEELDKVLGGASLHLYINDYEAQQIGDYLNYLLSGGPPRAPGQLYFYGFSLVGGHDYRVAPQLTV